jgi:FtsP/CotA-like multicopper oxidase with cupredoxin domain
MTQNNELNQDPTPSSLNRRVFLGAGVSAAAAFAMPSAAKAKTYKPAQISNPVLKQSTAPIYRPFVEPKAVFTQNNGKVTLGFVAEQTPVQVPQPDGTYQSVVVRNYNNAIPGPTIYVDPGDIIAITLQNNLPSPDPTCVNPVPNTPNCFNTTNIHFHGLHVSPSSYTDPSSGQVISSDDVLFEMAPGEYHQWCIWLPQFHAPGTHWYHSHKHGSTGIQVANGMAGALIIREPGQNSIVDSNNDFVWLLQEAASATDNVYNGVTTGQFLVNGVYQPTHTIHSPTMQGTLQRWRFINASATPKGLMNLKLYKCDANNCTTPASMYLMAVDGISFYGKKAREISTSGWNLAPGNRADFLINLEPGNYQLVKDLYQGNGAPGGNAGVTPTVLAYIKVLPPILPPKPMPLPPIFDPKNDIIPGQFPPYLQPIQGNEIVNNTTAIKFFIQAKGNYQIDGQQYSGCISHTAKLGTAEEWTLINNGNSGSASGGSAHPFHIHVNPFQLVGAPPEIALINPALPDTPDNRIWWDTIAVEPGTGTSQFGTPVLNNVKIWQRFSDYPGEFVLHCHILIHEDQGMMQNILIQDNGKGIGPCVPLPNPNHVPAPGPTVVRPNQPCTTPSVSPQATSSPAPSPKAGKGGGGGSGTGGGGGGGGRPRY